MVVVKRTGQDVDWNDDRDVWWDDVVGRQSTEHTPEAFDAEHPLYVMYTSGTTGKPKGILHTTGGYLVGTSYTHWAVFDLKDDDVFWTAADIGWVTGHSYIVYGAARERRDLGALRGHPGLPAQGASGGRSSRSTRCPILYCAPTAIRTFMKWGKEIAEKADLSARCGCSARWVSRSTPRRTCGTARSSAAGQAARSWTPGGRPRPAMLMISPLPGVTSGKPGSAMKALPGVSAVVVDDVGKPVAKGEGGYLVLTEPWPAMLRTIYGDDQRFKDTYWSRFENMYFAGDGAKLDEDGDIWLLGRVDDVMNVSGHRLSTTEIESALVSHPKVAEAAVVGAKDEDTGQAVCAFVILRDSAGDGGKDIVEELRAHVAKEIGKIARPRQIMVVPELPKTRSGKIMRRLLKDVAEDREVGDVTTLADSTVMNMISDNLQDDSAATRTSRRASPPASPRGPSGSSRGTVGSSPTGGTHERVPTDPAPSPDPTCRARTSRPSAGWSATPPGTSRRWSAPRSRWPSRSSRSASRPAASASGCSRAPRSSACWP